MKLEVGYRYMHGYLPSKRHRKLVYEEKEGVITVDIRVVSSEEAVLVARVRDYLKSENFNPKVQELRRYKSKWWRPVMSRFERTELMSKQELTDDLSRVYLSYNNSDEENSRDSIRNKIKRNANKYIIVDGVLYSQSYEPVWGVTTFGLGRNHGGTGLFITNPSRINKGFNLVDKDKAIAEAYEIAINRGDTKSAERFKIGLFETYDAEVLKPEYLKKFKKP